MTEGWDERTEAIPGMKTDSSVELDLDFSSEEAEESAPAGKSTIVVFEPHEIGLAHALAEMGYDVRSASTGVRVMSLVAEERPSVIICAPTPDAERRRLLVAALRLRFPRLPVVYVTSHASVEAAVLGAGREGARAVVAWPLPPRADVERVLSAYLPRAASAQGERPLPVVLNPDARSLGHPSARPAQAARRTSTVRLGNDGADSVRREEPTIVERGGASQPLPEPVTLQSDAFIPLPSIARHAADQRPGAAGEGRAPTAPTRDGDESADAHVDDSEVITEPGLRPAADAAVEARRVPPRGELSALLAAISPFLWSLEDAARWAESLGAGGNETAASHARTLHLLAKILAQLQARIDKESA